MYNFEETSDCSSSDYQPAPSSHIQRKSVLLQWKQNGLEIDNKVDNEDTHNAKASKEFKRSSNNVCYNRNEGNHKKEGECYKSLTRGSYYSNENSSQIDHNK